MRKVTQFAIATAIGTATVLGPTAAFVTPAAVAQVKTEHIDFSKTGSITVQSYTYDGQPMAPNANDNSASIPAGATPLAGTTYTLYRVQTFSNEGQFKTAADAVREGTLNPSNAGGTQVRELTTGSDGTVTFDNLDLGLYRVAQTGTAPGQSDGGQPDFLVFVPQTLYSNPVGDQSGTVWNYNPVAKPKNQPVGTTVKTVTDRDTEQTNTNAGGDITYRVESTVPGVNSDNRITKYVFTDQLEASTGISFNNDVSVFTTDGSGAGDVAFDAVDFSVTSATEGGNVNINVTLSERGLVKLAERKVANPAIRVGIQFTASVSAPDADGIINNSAFTVYSNPATGADITTEPSTVESRWGQIVIDKFDSENQDKLAGAEFQVYRCTVSDQGAVTLNGSALDFAGVTGLRSTFKDGSTDTFVTDAQGRAVIDGLKVGDHYNSQDQTVHDRFCLSEVKAPSGYELLDSPVAVDVVSASVDQSGVGYASRVVPVANVTSRLIDLPNTGGAGKLILLLAGLGVIGAGVTASRRGEKKA